MIRRFIAYALGRAIDFLEAMRDQLERYEWRKNYEAFQNGFEYAMDVLVEPDGLALLVEQAECDPPDEFSKGMLAAIAQWKRHGGQSV